MNTVSVSASIYEVTENILNLLTGDLSASSAKAYLASLRRSVSWDGPETQVSFPSCLPTFPTSIWGIWRAHSQRTFDSFGAAALCFTPTGKGAARARSAG